MKPMTKSPLQIARANYQPKLPAALLGNVAVVEGSVTESVADQAEIKNLFPNTYGMPIVEFEPSDVEAGIRSISGITGEYLIRIFEKDFTCKYSVEVEKKFDNISVALS